MNEAAGTPASGRQQFLAPSLSDDSSDIPPPRFSKPLSQRAEESNGMANMREIYSSDDATLSADEDMSISDIPVGPSPVTKEDAATAPTRNETESSGSDAGEGQAGIVRRLPSSPTNASRGRLVSKPPAKRTGNTKAASKRKSEPDMETVAMKDQLLDVGSPVYAPFPGVNPMQESYYWGLISKKSHSYGKWMYSIHFSDGDDLPKPITSAYIHRMAEMCQFHKTQHLELCEFPPKSYLQKWDPKVDGDMPQELRQYMGMDMEAAQSSSLTLSDLHARRCKDCTQCCIRQACASCDSCLENVGRDENDPDYKCCVQKMCLELDVGQKRQLSQYLPPGWSFYFLDVEESPALKGLVLTCGTGIQRFTSLDSAMKKAPKQFRGFEEIRESFLESVGLSTKNGKRKRRSEARTSTTVPLRVESSRNAATPAPKTTEQQLEQPWEPARLEEERCGQCRFCKRRRCDACSWCKDSSMGSEGKFCLKKICCVIQECHRAQFSPHLPTGWKFCFTQGRSHARVLWKLDGLILLAPNGRRFRSFESAMRQNADTFVDWSAIDMFYNSIAIELDEVDTRYLRRPSEDTWGNNPSRKRQRGEIPSIVNVTSPRGRGLRDSDDESKAERPTLRDFYRLRCRNCAMCNKPDCGRCDSCRDNRCKSERYPQVCLRKICESFDEDQRCQSARGLPPGWSFFFKADSNPREDESSMKDLVLVSPRQERKIDAEATLDELLQGSANRCELEQEFYRQVGAALEVNLNDHPLMGMPYWHEWLRIDGSRAAVAGQITKVVHDDVADEEKFTVSFDEEYRNNVNASAYGKLLVPKCVVLDSYEAWNGCIKGEEFLEQSNALRKQSSFYVGWKTPTSYTRKLIQHDEPSFPRETPCLQLSYKGFLLTFSVRKSLIENSGSGVFLAVRPAFTGTFLPPVFRLDCGELLDIGLYAPLRCDDYRKDHLHIVKSIIFGFKNEDYSFCAREEDYAFDITDDLTGELHYEARKHVTPFVNEISDPRNEIATIHAKLDPEGALHYLLGHTHEKHGPLEFPADGSEHEVLVDYGDDYENVRIREGYPRNQMDEQKVTEYLRNEERQYVDEFKTYSVNEVVASARMLGHIVEHAPRPSDMELVRMMIVAFRLRQRAAVLFNDFQGVNEDNSFCDGGVRDVDLGFLVEDCGAMISKIFQAWRRNTEVPEMLVAAKNCELFCDAFGQEFPLQDLHSLDTKGFETLFCSPALVCKDDASTVQGHTGILKRRRMKH